MTAWWRWRRRREARLLAELEFHLERQAADLQRGGLDPVTARRQARLRFGGLERFAEECRDARGAGWLEASGRDLRHGLRLLRRNPGFSAVAILTLALGIGANTAIFSLVYAVLLHPLPFGHADRVYQVMRRFPAEGQRTAELLSPPDYLDLQRQDHAFASTAAMLVGVEMTLAGEPNRVLAGAAVSPSLLAMLGFAPRLGRDFRPDDAQPGHDNVVILTDRAWCRQFGGDARVVGRTLTLDHAPYRVIGVLPPRFLLARDADFLTPLSINPEAQANRDRHSLLAFASLRPGVGVAAAQAETAALGARLQQRYPLSDQGQEFALFGLRNRIAGPVRPALLLLLASVGMVLLIACANLSNMLLARGAGRQRELAVRAALGASRARLLRQLLSEALVLALAGAALGLAVAPVALRLLLNLAPASLPFSGAVGLNGPVLGFTLALAVLAALACGAAPAWRDSRRPARAGLGERSSSGGRDAARARAALVVAEVAVALVLSTGAGLLLRSLANLSHQAPGFSPQSLLTFNLSLDAQHQTSASAAVALAALRQRLNALPGVRAAGAMDTPPLARGSDDLFTIASRPLPATDNQTPDALARFVTPGALAALGLHLAAGRWLRPGDTAAAPPVVIVNRALARQYFPGQNPLGQHLAIGGPAAGIKDIGMRTVVGVVDEARTVALSQPDPPVYYFPLAQTPPALDRWTGFTVLVRSQGDPLRLQPEIAAAARSLGAGFAVSDVASMDAELRQELGPQRFDSLLLGLFAAMGLTLAGIGVYAVLAYAVERRRAEIGVRMALGASPAAILRLLAVGALQPVGLGLAVGALASLALGRSLGRFLYGVSPADPATLAAAIGVFLLVALAAVLVPSLRALRVDPNQALRAD